MYGTSNAPKRCPAPESGPTPNFNSLNIATKSVSVVFPQRSIILVESFFNESFISFAKYAWPFVPISTKFKF